VLSGLAAISKVPGNDWAQIVAAAGYYALQPCTLGRGTTNGGPRDGAIIDKARPAGEPPGLAHPNSDP